MLLSGGRTNETWPPPNPAARPISDNNRNPPERKRTVPPPRPLRPQHKTHFKMGCRSRLTVACLLLFTINVLRVSVVHSIPRIVQIRAPVVALDVGRVPGAIWSRISSPTAERSAPTFQVGRARNQRDIESTNQRSRAHAIRWRT